MQDARVRSRNSNKITNITRFNNNNKQWGKTQSGEFNSKKKKKSCRCWRIRLNLLPELRVFPAPWQLFCNRSPSDAGRWEPAARRPPPRPCCPKTPTDTAGKSGWNVEYYLRVINTSIHARYSAHARWRRPPRNAAWEMESFRPPRSSRGSVETTTKAS